MQYQVGSHLALNPEKTVLLTTIRTGPGEWCMRKLGLLAMGADADDPNLLPLVDSATYLGFKIGRNLTPTTLFKPVLKSICSEGI